MDLEFIQKYEVYDFDAASFITLIAWQGMQEPQNFFDTIFTTFGFLTVAVNLSKYSYLIIYKVRFFYIIFFLNDMT